MTSTGTKLLVVLPLPSCPYSLLPQHLTAPPLVMAQLWALPALMAVTPLFSPVTSTGTGLVVVLPLPSCPVSLVPQHLTAPPLVRAQLCTIPALMDVTPLPSPVTSTGIRLPVVLPLPSCLYPLLPQHLTAPLGVRAQLCNDPALMAVTPLPSPVTSTGTELSVVLPLPSCPNWLKPQHLTAPPLVRAQL